MGGAEIVLDHAQFIRHGAHNHNTGLRIHHDLAPFRRADDGDQAVLQVFPEIHLGLSFDTHGRRAGTGGLVAATSTCASCTTSTALTPLAGLIKLTARNTSERPASAFHVQVIDRIDARLHAAAEHHEALAVALVVVAEARAQGLHRLGHGSVLKMQRHRPANVGMHHHAVRRALDQAHEHLAGWRVVHGQVEARFRQFAGVASRAAIDRRQQCLGHVGRHLRLGRRLARGVRHRVFHLFRRLAVPQVRVVLTTGQQQGQRQKDRKNRVRGERSHHGFVLTLSPALSLKGEGVFEIISGAFGGH